MGLDLLGSHENARVSLYAYDTTAIVCSEQSVSKLFSIAELYGRASGVKLNTDKCQGVLLGFLAGCASFYSSFAWSREPIKICGMMFSSVDTSKIGWKMLVLKIRAANLIRDVCGFSFKAKAMYIVLF